VIELAEYGKIDIKGNEFLSKTKVIRQKELTSDCRPVQVWGLPYCRDCKYLATEDCGGYRIRKSIFSGKYPKNGLPDAGSR
jgi:hypothetical protein